MRGWVHTRKPACCLLPRRFSRVTADCLQQWHLGALKCRLPGAAPGQQGWVSAGAGDSRDTGSTRGIPGVCCLSQGRLHFPCVGLNINPRMPRTNFMTTTLPLRSEPQDAPGPPNRQLSKLSRPFSFTVRGISSRPGVYCPTRIGLSFYILHPRLKRTERHTRILLLFGHLPVLTTCSKSAALVTPERNREEKQVSSVGARTD